MDRLDRLIEDMEDEERGERRDERVAALEAALASRDALLMRGLELVSSLVDRAHVGDDEPIGRDAIRFMGECCDIRDAAALPEAQADASSASISLDHRSHP